jgi:hypothetical protein
MPEPLSPPQALPPQSGRPRRFWLFAPYAALLVAVLGWTGVWWAEKSRVEQTLRDQAAALTARGYAAAFTVAGVDGWPFRLHLTLLAPRFGEPSGWSVSAPRLEAEAAAYDPGRWTLIAPDGLVLTRPGKGPLNVSGRAIRASAGGLGSGAPRFSFEGLDLTLTPAPGGQPAAFTTAGRVEAHLQPGPEDQGALLIRVERAALRSDSTLGRLAPGQPFGLVWDSRLSHLSALRGESWPAAIQAWIAAGGFMRVAQGEISLGGLQLQGAGGPLVVDANGRLSGSLPLTLQGAQAPNPGALGVLSQTGPIPLRFQGGRATIGPFPIGPALKVG